MKSKYLFAVIVLAFVVQHHALAQDSIFRYIKTISDSIRDFTVDNLDNIYLISPTDQLKKINSNGDSAAVFNDVKKYGKLTAIDVSNPLRVMLYYKGFGTVVTLDRFLNVKSSIDLRKLNLYQVSAIALAYDNNIWVFDVLENKLKKITEEVKVAFETPDFRMLFGEAIIPVSIFDRDGFVYLYDPKNGIFVFDYYGGFKKKIPVIGWKDCKVAGKAVFGITEDTLHRFQLDNLQELNWEIPEILRGFRKLDFTASRLYALKPEGLDVYELR